MFKFSYNCFKYMRIEFSFICKYSKFRSKVYLILFMNRVYLNSCNYLSIDNRFILIKV